MKLEEVQMGMNVIVLKGSSVKMNTEGVIERIYEDADDVVCIRVQNGGAYDINCKYLRSVHCTIAQLRTELAVLDAEVKKAEDLVKAKEAQITYMMTTGLVLFIETEYKVWQTLQLLKDEKIDELSKVKIIAGLLK